MTVGRSGKMPASTWKDHPVIIVIVAGAAVAAFMVSVVFPMLTTIQAQKLEAALNKSKNDDKRIEVLRGSLKTASASLREASKQLRNRSDELRSLRLGAMFDAISPLPYGWRAVPLGSDKSLIEARYSERNIENDDGIVTVSGDGMPFRHANFYIADGGWIKFVRLSHLNVEIVDGKEVNTNDSIVNRKLRDAFGEPDLINKESLCWFGRNGADFVNDGMGLLVLPSGKYVLSDCGSEDEIVAARAKSSNYPIPKEVRGK